MESRSVTKGHVASVRESLSGKSAAVPAKAVGANLSTIPGRSRSESWLLTRRGTKSSPKGRAGSTVGGHGSPSARVVQGGGNEDDLGFELSVPIVISRVVKRRRTPAHIHGRPRTPASSLCKTRLFGLSIRDMPWNQVCECPSTHSVRSGHFSRGEKWRTGWDSNPRYLAVNTLSRRAQSTTLAPVRDQISNEYP